jgi:hypothetical protein
MVQLNPILEPEKLTEWYVNKSRTLQVVVLWQAENGDPCNAIQTLQKPIGYLQGPPHALGVVVL